MSGGEGLVDSDLSVELLEAAETVDLDSLLVVDIAWLLVVVVRAICGAVIG